MAARVARLDNLISFPDLLWTKPKGRSGKVRKFVFLNWLLHLTAVQSSLWKFTRFSAANVNVSNVTNMVQSVKFATFDKNLCCLCGNTTNTNQRYAIFSNYRKTVIFQRLKSDFAKVRAQDVPQCRLILEREERKSSGLGAHQNQALLPCVVLRKGRKKSGI